MTTYVMPELQTRAEVQDMARNLGLTVSTLPERTYSAHSDDDVDAHGEKKKVLQKPYKIATRDA